MAKKASYPSTKRFGSKYGKRLRDKYGSIESEQRKKHICPYCHYEQVKRLAIGIWNCKKCGAKFTSKAYTVSKISPIKIEVEKE
ncbi:MAG: 50S ribosomal protein L37ae [Nanoarchaeota archaeon]|nr:50S ribosomal protein L37ae [Nanoarchaeota archaeon]MBU1269415.1 50S ribosomal protein L37ae [Nanoarchaeota archaeon]MBU1603710.1 50S ribosomal protein L37ae [Nanoarchaeota archaeon]MBU2442947.1 50S ribosomal protein L37ae [Nanoarchaeota archaeon]